MDMGDLVLSADTATFVRDLVRGACVNETIAAAEASLQAEGVASARLKSALQKMGEDEGRHAALGWRTLAWMLAREPSLTIVAEQALATYGAPPDTHESEGLSEWGILDASEHRALHREILRSVVRPLFEAVVDAASTNETPLSRNRNSAPTELYDRL